MNDIMQNRIVILYRIIFLSIIGLYSAISYGQPTTFSRSYDTLGCYYSSDIAQYVDGGYIICGGSAISPSNNDASIIRIDSLGNIIWAKNYGSTYVDGGKAVLITPDSDIIITGVYKTLAYWDRKLWIMKLNSLGNQIWSYTYTISGGSEPTDIRFANDGMFIISGFCTANQNSVNNAFLAKIDTTGNLIWSKVYTPLSGDDAMSVASLNDGGFVFAGQTGISGNPDGLVIRTNDIGDTLWTKVIDFNNGSGDFFRGINITVDSFILAVGGTYSSVVGHYNMLLVKLDLNGNIIWMKQFDNGYESSGANILSDSTSFYIAGTTNSPDLYDFYLIKTDTTGDTLWSKRYAEFGYQTLYSMCITSDSGFVMSGISSTTNGKAHVLKANNRGDLITSLINRKYFDDIFSIYPNPVNDILNIHFNAPIEASLNIYNSLGESLLFREVNFAKDLHIMLNEIPSGLYFLVLSNKDLSFKKRLLIIH